MGADLEEIDDLEEKCVRMRHRVVHCRKKYPAYLSSMDDKIAKLEAALLRRELSGESEPTHEPAVEPSNESFQFAPSNHKQFLVAVERARDVNRVIAQIKNDETHIQTRQRIDSAAILERIHRTNIQN